MELEYVSSYGETSRRTVYPLKLVFKSKSWYLQGFCRTKMDYRIFKLNRILSTELTEEAFARTSYTPPAIEDSQMPPASLIALELVFAPHAAYRAYDEFDVGCIQRDDDGQVHVFTCLPEDGWLYGFLRSLGDDVTVLAPAHVRENLAKG